MKNQRVARLLIGLIGLPIVFAAAPICAQAAPSSRCGDRLGSLMDTPEGKKLLKQLPMSSRRIEPPSFDYLGEPKPGPYAHTLLEVAEAVDRVLGLDVHCIKVVVLSNDELEARFSRRGRRIAPGTELGGFHRPSLDTFRTVFVRDEGGLIHPVVLAHEVMHALSQRFSAQADHRRFRKLPEGLAQHFALNIIPSSGEPGEWRWRNVYSGPVAVGVGLERLVGPDVLAAAFFVDGLDILERAVDAIKGRGTFQDAMSALEKGYVRLALSMLRPPGKR